MKYQYHTAANRHLTQSGSAQSGYNRANDRRRYHRYFGSDCNPQL